MRIPCLRFFKRRRMDLLAAIFFLNRHQRMTHLVKDCRLHNKGRDEFLIEPRVKGDELTRRRVAPHLHLLVGAAVRCPPSNLGLYFIFKKFLVEAVEDFLEIEKFSFRSNRRQRMADPMPMFFDIVVDRFGAFAVVGWNVVGDFFCDFWRAFQKLKERIRFL